MRERDVQHVELICVSGTVPSLHFQRERQRFIHSAALRLLYNSLLLCALEWAGFRGGQLKFSVRLFIIEIGQGLTFFPCFRFRAYFNNFPLVFVSANHCPSVWFLLPHFFLSWLLAVCFLFIVLIRSLSLVITPLSLFLSFLSLSLFSLSLSLSVPIWKYVTVSFVFVLIVSFFFW